MRSLLNNVSFAFSWIDKKSLHSAYCHKVTEKVNRIIIQSILMCILKKFVKKTQGKDKQAKTSLMDRDFSGAQFYLHSQKSAKNENLRPIEGQMETLFFVLFCLLRTCSFHILPIYNENFCNEAFVEPGSCLKVVWISEIICLTKDNFQIQTYSSKDFHKSMLKSWNFAKITSATDALIIICWKLSKEIFLKTPPDRSFC